MIHDPSPLHNHHSAAGLLSGRDPHVFQSLSIPTFEHQPHKTIAHSPSRPRPVPIPLAILPTTSSAHPGTALKDGLFIWRLSEDAVVVCRFSDGEPGLKMKVWSWMCCSVRSLEIHVTLSKDYVLLNSKDNGIHKRTEKDEEAYCLEEDGEPQECSSEAIVQVIHPAKQYRG